MEKSQRSPLGTHLSHLEPGVSFVLMHLALELAQGAQAAPHLAIAAPFGFSIRTRGSQTLGLPRV
jgi:hypothetical protein